MTAFNVSCSSSDKFLAIRACLCKKSCVHCAIGALSLIRFTTQELIPMHAAAPSVQTPAQFSQDKKLLWKNPSRLLKMSSPLQCNLRVLQNKRSYTTLPPLTNQTKTKGCGRPAISVDSSN